jgi:hypothetical protein
MPFEDTELTALAAARDQTRDLREQAKAHHDNAYEHLSSLHSDHDGRIEWLSSEGDSLHQQMGDAFSQSKACFDSGDHGRAGEWSSQGKALKARLAEVNGEKNAPSSATTARSN